MWKLSMPARVKHWVDSRSIWTTLPYLLLESERTATPPEHDEMYSLQPVSIADGSLYSRKSIREIGIGDTAGALIVGIEREGKRLLNPESSEILHPGDLVWVFGHRDRIRDLRRTS